MKTPRYELLLGETDGMNVTFRAQLDFVPGSVVPHLNGTAVLEQSYVEMPPRAIALQYPPRAGDQVSAYYVVM